ncbi:MAG: hypothetical protein KGI54_18515 [Pseudomonadota bacterium]|nr:hypothetical protein [Pseudomonadota bacterium]
MSNQNEITKYMLGRKKQGEWPEVLNKFGQRIDDLPKGEVKVTPPPSAKEADLYYRCLPGDITEAEYERIIEQENDYNDYL